MLKRGLLMGVVLLGLLINNLFISDIKAGEYAVGTIYDYGTFSSQPRWGIRGYIIIEPNGLAQSGSGRNIIYHTMTNSSRYGSETIIAYYLNDINFVSYKWVPSGKNFVNNLDSSDTASTGWWGEKNIGSADGTIDSNFQKYVTTLTLSGAQYKAIFIENVSDWNSGQSKWNEVTRLKNFNAGNMDVVMDISWDGSQSDNFTSDYNGHNQWAGCFETFNTGTRFSSNNGKKAGCYLMDYINSSGNWTAFDTPKCRLRDPDTTYEYVCYSGWCIHSANSGFDCVNSSPVPGYWLATVP